MSNLDWTDRVLGISVLISCVMLGVWMGTPSQAAKQKLETRVVKVYDYR